MYVPDHETDFDGQRGEVWERRGSQWQIVIVLKCSHCIDKNTRSSCELRTFARLARRNWTEIQESRWVHRVGFWRGTWQRELFPILQHSDLLSLRFNYFVHDQLILILLLWFPKSEAGMCLVIHPWRECVSHTLVGSKAPACMHQIRHERRVST